MNLPPLCRALQPGLALTLALLVPAGALAEPPSAATPEPTIAQISRRFDDLYRSSSSHGRFRMHVRTPNYERSLEIEAWSRGADHTLIRIHSPRKEKGVSTLRRGKEMWNYLPKIRKTIRIPAAMMAGSWMGSGFTNDDLVRESSWEDDYVATILPGDPAEICLDYRARPDAAVPWPRVVACFERARILPLRTEYWDEKERKARVVTYSDIRELGGRALPTKMTLRPLLKEGYITELVYESMEFDLELADDLFSLTSLRRSR